MLSLDPNGNEHDLARQFQVPQDPEVGSKTYAYYSLPAAEKNGLKGISRLPFSMKVLLENLLRNEDGRSVTKEDIQAFAHGSRTRPPSARSRSARRAC